MAHFRFIPTTGGRIIHGSKVHNLQKGEEHENQDATAERKSLHSGLQLPLIVQAQPSITGPLSPFHTENSPVTSALAFGDSGSPAWGSELGCCPLEDGSSPNAAQPRAGGAKLHFSAVGGGEHKSCNHLKHFILIIIVIKILCIFFRTQNLSTVISYHFNNGSWQFLVFQITLHHWLWNHVALLSTAHLL